MGNQMGALMKSASIPALLFVLGLAACAQSAQTSRSSMALQNQVSSDASQAARLPQSAAGPQMLAAEYDVQAVTVTVPKSLVVSEANSFLPKADIVWRGDAPGDRYAQVKAIFDDAASKATASMQSGPKVVVDLEVTKFHCLTEKTRYTVGGVHSMHFLMTVRDVETGAILQGPRLIVADVHGAGGARAMAEEAVGRTQKVVVTERLVTVLQRELSAPVSVVPADALVTRFNGTPAQLPGLSYANDVLQ